MLTNNGESSVLHYSKIVLLTAAALCALAALPAFAKEDKVLFSFSSIDQGFHSVAPVLRVSTALYGTTEEGGQLALGNVFQLTPPSNGQLSWNETVLYNFTGKGDGGGPMGGLIADKSGALYGLANTSAGANVGTAFKLSPPASGQGKWTFMRLHAFTDGADGGFPNGALTAGPNGVLYGTTSAGGAHGVGTVFSLTPPSGGATHWGFSTLYTFTNANDGGAPLAGVARAEDGTLYGTTLGGGADGLGVIFSLTPPAEGQTKWTEQTLFTFNFSNGAEAAAAPILDAQGNLYGTASEGGAFNSGLVWELSPPAAGGTTWTETPIYNFTGQKDGGFPVSSLLLGKGGKLYGTSESGIRPSNGGVVFKLTPLAAGSANWTFHGLHTFRGGNDGQLLFAAPIFDGANMLVTTTRNGGSNNLGTVVSVVP
jgi:uncharacterized repeat protein (TIGR03803 family)